MTDSVHLSWGQIALRLVVAAVFGGVIGAEREMKGHDAGIRTNLLLALGAALFGVISVGGFESLVAGRNATNVSLDPTRVASYVAAGVGFIGGGAIIKSDEHIRGLTTAASLWLVAAIGLAAGLGLWAGAVLATAIGLAALLAERAAGLVERFSHGSTAHRRGPRSRRGP